MRPPLGYLRKTNPWWEDLGQLPSECDLPRRDGLFDAIEDAVFNPPLRRSVILLGQRRVGKTVILFQLLDEAIKNRGFEGGGVCYVDFESVDSSRSPVAVVDAFKQVRPPGKSLVIFDEVQECKNWESELKLLTDHEKDIQFVVTGSAASALKKRSTQSGQGRFLDFYVHPLLFCEYLLYSGNWRFGLSKGCSPDECLTHRFDNEEISSLNDSFMRYMLYGAFPEMGMRERPPKNLHRYLDQLSADTIIRSSTPQQFGIMDGEKLENLYRYLVSVNGQVSATETLCKEMGMDYRTVTRYLQFLISAYLIRRHDKVGTGAKSLLRNRNAKYVVVNPSIAALSVDEVSISSEGLGHLIEATAIAQHPPDRWHVEKTSYFSWNSNNLEHEIDIVKSRDAGRTRVIRELCEIKWGDSHLARSIQKFNDAVRLLEKQLSEDCRKVVTTKSVYGSETGDQSGVVVLPTAQYCLSTSKRTLRSQGE